MHPYGKWHWSYGLGMEGGRYLLIKPRREADGTESKFGEPELLFCWENMVGIHPSFLPPKMVVA